MVSNEDVCGCLDSILNSFLGFFVTFRLIQSLFPQDPNFRGRRVVTFHNQRDFIFFRHHRYVSVACVSYCNKNSILFYRFGFLTNTFCYHVFRYIFESKESKETNSEGKKAKDAKLEKAPQDKVVARLQVSVNLFVTCICISRF